VHIFAFKSFDCELNTCISFGSQNNILFLYQAVEHLFDEHVQKQVHDKTESKLNTTSTMTSSTSTDSSVSSIVCMNNKIHNNDHLTPIKIEHYDNINPVDQQQQTKMEDYENDMVGDGSCTESTNRRISNMFVRQFNLVLNMSSNLRRSLLLSLKKQQTKTPDDDINKMSSSVEINLQPKIDDSSS
jgi:hypothetical protein